MHDRPLSILPGAIVSRQLKFAAEIEIKKTTKREELFLEFSMITISTNLSSYLIDGFVLFLIIKLQKHEVLLLVCFYNLYCG